MHIDEYVNCIKKVYNENITQKYIKKYLVEWATEYKKYNYYNPSDWTERKKNQLYNQLTTVIYIVTFIKSYQQGYRFIGYSGWTIILKYLANPE